MLHKVHFILYVRDQAKSTAFYRAVLDEAPTLEVPGMTEFALPGGAVLGLMPEEHIGRLLVETPTRRTPDSPARAELYLVVDHAALFHARACSAGATQLSHLQLRNWGHVVAYSLDLDGHVLAFAQLE